MRSQTRFSPTALFCLLFAFSPLFALNSQAQINVLTRHYGNARTAANLSETTLNVSNVNVNTFGKLFTRDVDGEIYAQPLFVSNLNLPGVGTKNVVFVATAHNSIYAYDADSPDSKIAPYWHVNLGTPAPSGAIPTRNLPVEIGIISTPVIDLATQTMYVCAKTQESSNLFAPSFHIYALDLKTGQPKMPRVEVTGAVDGTGEDNVNGIVTFTPFKHNQRAALTLANGRLYVAFASHEDYNPYHGWVFVYDAATLNRLFIHCNTPDGGYGGIWMSGEGLNVDAQGNLYYINGNGFYDGVRNFGLSVVKLSPDAKVLDWFTPSNYQYLNDIDFDLGSSGGILLPGTNYLVSGGKEGIIYVMNTANMGHLNSAGDAVQQRFAASPGHVHSSMAHWNSPQGSTLYVWGESDYLKAFRWQGDHFSTTPSSMSAVPVTDGYANGPGMAISAHNSDAGSGVIWANLPFIGDATDQHVPGILRAFDASDVSKELWNSHQNKLRDDNGIYAKFCPPLIANGRVYLATFTGKLMVYGIEPLTAPAPVTTLQAIPGNGMARLRWTNVDRASSFTLKRSTSPVGPYSVVAANLLTTDTVDHNLTNGVTYYYTVIANSGAYASAASNIASCQPTTTAHGTSINLDFVGSTLQMGEEEVAGVYPGSRWNAATGQTGILAQLPDNGAHPSDMSLDWNASAAYFMGLTDAPGDVRMMNGLLDTYDTSTNTVHISNVPQWLTSAGYRVIIYCDGDWVYRTGTYTLNGVTEFAHDNSNFSGTFINGTNGTGNYIVFDNLTAANLTLTATPASGGLRAPINGIQLTLKPATLSGQITLEGVTNPAQTVTMTYRTSDGSTPISHTVTLDSSGSFTLNEMPRLPGVLHIKGRKSLAVNVPLDLSGGTATLPSGIVLLTGDVDGNNVVNVDDLSLLLFVFNTTSGDGVYDENADLDGSGTVNVDDLFLLLYNFNVNGDE